MRSECPEFGVRRLPVDLEPRQVHRVSLARVLIDLNDSEGGESVVADVVAEDGLVDSPGRRASWLADGAEGLLRVEVAVAGVQCLPIDEVIGAFKAPARHHRAFLQG